MANYVGGDKLVVNVQQVTAAANLPDKTLATIGGAVPANGANTAFGVRRLCFPEDRDRGSHCHGHRDCGSVSGSSAGCDVHDERLRDIDGFSDWRGRAGCFIDGLHRRESIDWRVG